MCAQTTKVDIFPYPDIFYIDSDLILSIYTVKLQEQVHK